ncbi:YokE-like PH domain-containing protein [Flavobacterium longum]|uniref:PH domain-containing protein n=1 Tax=Flavobacterium longum TaxID=1299340 RepID=UPI0039EB0DE0
MKDSIKSFLNEEQDPKAVEKITAKLQDLLMKGEEIGYIGVQKKPAITVFPDSIVLTNKRIILCEPKNLGLSMDFTDYAWEDIAGTFVKENILGSEFSFSTKTDIQVSIDYIPKTQARKIYTFAKEQLELLKSPVAAPAPETMTGPAAEIVAPAEPEIEEVQAEEVTDFAEIIPVAQSGYRFEKQHPEEEPTPLQTTPQPTGETSEQLFEKLQNYKKLLDNGLILQGEYDALKKEILSKM